MTLKRSTSSHLTKLCSKTSNKGQLIPIDRLKCGQYQRFDHCAWYCLPNFGSGFSGVLSKPMRTRHWKHLREVHTSNNLPGQSSNNDKLTKIAPRKSNTVALNAAEPPRVGGNSRAQQIVVVRERLRQPCHLKR